MLAFTIKSIKDYGNKSYITFYNKYWLGVTSATVELFENLVDCGEIYRKEDISDRHILKTVTEKYAPLNRDDAVYFIYSILKSNMGRFDDYFYEKKWFDNIIYMDFEGYKMPCPRNYREILTERYGDYMKIPSKNKRQNHTFYLEKI